MRIVKIKAVDGIPIGKIKVTRSGEYVGLDVDDVRGGGVGVALDEDEVTELIRALQDTLAEVQAYQT
jgi:hypothetical protein